jgi:hypothetical protein
MSILTVALPTDNPAAAAAFGQAVASLPGRYCLVGESAATADVQIIDGAVAGWVTRATSALESRPRLLVVTEPDLSDLASIRELLQHAADLEVQIVADSPYLADQTWASALNELQVAARTAAAIDSVLTVNAHGSDRVVRLQDARQRHLALLYSLVGGVDMQEVVDRPGSHYLIIGDQGPTAITLTGVLASTDSLEVDIFDIDQHWSIRFDGRAAAAPTTITLSTGEGDRTRRPQYQSGTRAQWAAQHQALESGQPCEYPIAGLIAQSR